MRYTYDDDADALYIHLDEDTNSTRSVVVDEGRVIDVDEEGRPVGIEVLGASEGVQLLDLIDRFSLGDFRGHLEKLEGASFQKAPTGT